MIISIIETVVNSLTNGSTTFAFGHGAEYFANLELDEANFPVIYLDTPVDNEYQLAQGGYIGEEYNLEIFFMFKSEMDYTPSQLDELCIEPANDAIRNFISACQASPDIDEVSGASAVEYTHLLDVDVSGKQLSITIKPNINKSVCVNEVALNCKAATILDSDGVSTFTVASGGNGTCTPAASPSGIAYQTIPNTGQLISYRTGDDGDANSNGLHFNSFPAYPINFAQQDYLAVNPFTTLVDNNIAGNKSRFTDENDLQVYGNGLVKCHLNKRMYYVVVLPSNNWNNLIDAANASTQGGFNDWRLANIEEIEALGNKSLSDTMNYAPINIGANNFHSSTTNPDDITESINYDSSVTGGRNRGVSKTTNRVGLMIRNF